MSGPACCCRYLVQEARRLGLEVIDRCNLTVLLEPGQEDLVSFLAQHQVILVTKNSSCPLLACACGWRVCRSCKHGLLHTGQHIMFAGASVGLSADQACALAALPLCILLCWQQSDDMPAMQHSFWRRSCLQDHCVRLQVRIVASLPCYSEQNVDQQRGSGVFHRSIRGLQMLNEAGYGEPGTGLHLDLVYNPNGIFLAPQQSTLEVG